MSMRVSQSKREKLYVTVKDILGYVAMWAIRQSPFFPDEFEPMLRELSQKVSDSSRFRAVPLLSDGYQAVEFKDWRDLLDFLTSITETIPSFRNLNLSKIEKEHHIEVDDPKRGSFVFTSALNSPKPEFDFVDIDALRRNVCVSIEREQER